MEIVNSLFSRKEGQRFFEHLASRYTGARKTICLYGCCNVLSKALISVRSRISGMTCRFAL